MKFNKGYLYEIEFKDHSVHSIYPFECKAVGYVLEDHKDYVQLSSWIVKTEDVDIFNNNLENFVILKICINKRRLLCKTKQK